jgi:hypothetical protein
MIDQTHELQILFNPLVTLQIGKAPDAWAKADILGDCQPLKEGAVCLKDHATFGRRPCDCLAVNQDGSTCRRFKAGYQVQQGRFAAA